MSYKDKITGDARLIILRELAKQVDGRLNEISIRRVLDMYSIVRSREWLHTQLIAMAELDAITTIDAEDIKVAAITPQGRHHLEQRIVIAGIARPAELEV